MYTKTNSDAAVVTANVPDEAFFTDGDALYVKMPANSVYKGLACAANAVSETCGPYPEREREADFKYKANVISGTEYVILSDIQRDMRQMKIPLGEFVSAMATAESTRDGKDGDFHYPPYGSPFAAKTESAEKVEDVEQNKATNEGDVSAESESPAEEDSSSAKGDEKLAVAVSADESEDDARSGAHNAGKALFARVRLNNGEVIYAVKAKNRENVFKEIAAARLKEETSADPLSHGSKNNPAERKFGMTK